MRRTEPPPPCFYFAACGNLSEIEKGGRSICRKCSAKVQGREFPLKKNGWDMSPSADVTRWQLDMYEPQRPVFVGRLP